MLSWLGLDLVSCTNLQSLWAGYGHICRVIASTEDDEVATRFQKYLVKSGNGSAKRFSLILKLISPPPTSNQDEGHLRKMLSYEVEQYFYDEVTPHLLEDHTAVAKCLASTRNLGEHANAKELEGILATLMTDLSLEFPVSGEKRSVLTSTQVEAALEWLANFHSSSWKLLPDNLNDYLLPPLEEAKRRQISAANGGSKIWLNGGYTYLATRRQEYASLADGSDPEWSVPFCEPTKGSSLSITEKVAQYLTPSGRPFETYIHGDVKSENLFTTVSGDQIAMYDFQYVGIGIGACDLAKLFTCSVPLKILTNDRSVPNELPMEEGERSLLEKYLQALHDGRPQQKRDWKYDWDLFVRHWETALIDWCRFQASWGFWGNTDWLEARVRYILKDDGWRAWLDRELATR